jgi:uncharacterized protein YjbI with pentapeptide repeats
MSRSELQARWSSKLIEAANRLLMRGLPEKSPFGEMPDGYADMRGLVIREFLNGVKLNRIDLSGCKLEWAGQFDYSTVKDCLFVDADLPASLGTDFQNCVFINSRLNGAVFRGRFENCNFQEANLSATLGNQVKFTKCNFTDANLRKVQLLRCKFIECRFAGARFGNGSLSYSEFQGCDITLDGVGNTMMEKVKIS